MMVTLVRGNIQDVHETLQYDADNPTGTSVSVEMDASKLWSGDEDRGGQLKAADFLDVENHPTITFTGD